MAVAKVILNGTTLMDVTADTVTANNLVTGNTATKADGVRVTGTFNGVDTSDATAVAGEIMSGKTAYVNGSKVTGTAAVSVSGTTLIMPSGLVSV